MREQAEETRSRRRRCENHPDSAAVARCARCGRRLCIACAIPVRGIVVGPECLPEVLPDTSVPVPAPLVTPRRWDVVAALGFGLVLGLTLFPWSKFGEDSGRLEAWAGHWSLLASASASAGLVAALVAVLRPFRTRLEAALYGMLALASAAGAVLHYLNPPPLSEPSVIPLLAVIGPLVVVAVAVRKVLATLHRLGEMN